MVEHRPNREQVTNRTALVRLLDLGSLVGPSPSVSKSPHQIVCKSSAGAKVSYLQPPGCLIQQQVVRFNIPVGDLIAVKESQCLCDASEPPNNVFEGHLRPLNFVRHELRQWDAVHEFHLHNPYRADTALPIDGDHAGMLWQVEHVLAVDHQHLFAPVWVKRDFQGDWSIRCRIELPCPPHLAELASADDRLKLVVGTQSLSWMKKHRCHTSLRKRTKWSKSACRPMTACINITLVPSGRRTTGPTGYRQGAVDVEPLRIHRVTVHRPNAQEKHARGSVAPVGSNVKVGQLLEHRFHRVPLEFDQYDRATGRTIKPRRIDADDLTLPLDRTPVRETQ